MVSMKDFKATDDFPEYSKLIRILAIAKVIEEEREVIGWLSY